MEKRGWKNWEGKKVFIETIRNRQYAGHILEVEQRPINSNSKLYWITLKDKFGNYVGFADSEIKLIQEEA